MADSRIYEKKAFEEFKNKLKPEIVTKYLIMKELNIIPDEVTWLIMGNLFYRTDEYIKYKELIDIDVDKIKKVNILIAMMKYKEFQIDHRNYNLEPAMIELFDLVAADFPTFDKVEALTLSIKFIIPDDYYDLLSDKFKLSKDVDRIFSCTADKLTFKHLL
jgi:hypothetical protein